MVLQFKNIYNSRPSLVVCTYLAHSAFCRFKIFDWSLSCWKAPDVFIHSTVYQCRLKSNFLSHHFSLYIDWFRVVLDFKSVFSRLVHWLAVAYEDFATVSGFVLNTPRVSLFFWAGLLMLPMMSFVLRSIQYDLRPRSTPFLRLTRWPAVLLSSRRSMTPDDSASYTKMAATLILWMCASAWNMTPSLGQKIIFGQHLIPSLRHWTQLILDYTKRDLNLVFGEAQVRWATVKSSVFYKCATNIFGQMKIYTVLTGLSKSYLSSKT